MVREDLEALKKSKEADGKAPSVFVEDCETPENCNFNEICLEHFDCTSKLAKGPCRIRRACTYCRLRPGPHPETMELLEIATALKGGCPIPEESLAWDQWVAIGEIRRQTEGI